MASLHTTPAISVVSPLYMYLFLPAPPARHGGASKGGGEGRGSGGVGAYCGGDGHRPGGRGNRSVNIKLDLQLNRAPISIM